MIESSAARASKEYSLSTGAASGGGSVFEATACAFQPAARMASWVAVSALISAKAAWASIATGSSISRESSFFILGQRLLDRRDPAVVLIVGEKKVACCAHEGPFSFNTKEWFRAPVR